MPDILRSVRHTIAPDPGRHPIPWRLPAALFLIAALLGLALATWLGTVRTGAASETEADLMLVLPER